MKQISFVQAVVAAALIATLIIFVGCPDESANGATPTATYTCENGTAKSGTPSGTTDVEACQSCKSGFKLMGAANADGTTCVAESTAVYTCENGTPVTGTPSGAVDVERCTSCASGYTLSGTAGADGTTCVKDTTDSTAPTFTAGPVVKPGSIGATSVTVTLTASEVGKVFWVLYADGTPTPADAAALIHDATRDTAPSTAVVLRSATAQVDITTDAVEIALTGLTKSTTYNFYAVLQDAAKNTSDLSAKLAIPTATTVKYTCENGTPQDGTPTGTADVAECKACNAGFALTTEKKCVADSTDGTPPTFSAGPTLDTTTDTSATVKLTASEAGKLFWVLYADGTPAPADRCGLN